MRAKGFGERVRPRKGIMALAKHNSGAARKRFQCRHLRLEWLKLFASCLLQGGEIILSKTDGVAGANHAGEILTCAHERANGDRERLAFPIPSAQLLSAS